MSRTPKSFGKKRKKLVFDLHLYLVMVIVGILIAVTLLSFLIVLLLDEFRLSTKIPNGLLGIILIIILDSIVSGILSRVFLYPITKLSLGMNSVAAGDFSVRLETKSKSKQIRHLYRDFNQMAQELASTEMLQSDFVSSVSHEFKTPINAIEGYAMLLQGDPNLSEEQAEYLEKILFNTRRLSGLTSNILLLSKLDSQAIPAKVDSYRLDEQIRQAIVALEGKWSGKDIDLDVELDDVTYTGNESLLFHAWMNLIDNAVKFSPRGGHVRIGLTASEQEAVFTVQDEGPGIAEEDRRRIFDKFYQSDSSHKDEGNGLGLALVKKIVSMHQGGISVENCDWGGCKFTVRLPMAAAE